MQIIWNQNPLATVIELDEFDKRLLRLRIEVDYLTNRIMEAHYDLNPPDREWHNEHIKSRTLDEAVVAALQVLGAPFVLGEEKRAGHTFIEYLEKRLTDSVEALAGAHCGDCTCVACPCDKCRAESLVGTDTTSGLDKHAGSCVSGAFASRPDGGTPSLEDAIESLRNYRPTKGPAWDKFSEEEFQAYVPRWTEEAARARGWLIAYQREHFGTLEAG